jgi:hypothetical protein
MPWKICEVKQVYLLCYILIKDYKEIRNNLAACKKYLFRYLINTGLALLVWHISGT